MTERKPTEINNDLMMDLRGVHKGLMVNSGASGPCAEPDLTTPGECDHMSKNRSRIACALSALLVRRNEDSFVIIEHAKTKKFVQFAGSATEQLSLDLPSQTLSEAEFYNAVQLFRSMGIIGDEHDVYDKPDGVVVGRQFSFNTTFRSVIDATRMVEELFTKVYGFPVDCDIEIIEN